MDRNEAVALAHQACAEIGQNMARMNVVTTAHIDGGVEVIAKLIQDTVERETERLREINLSMLSMLRSYHGLISRVTPDKNGWRAYSFCEYDISRMAKVIADARAAGILPNEGSQS